MATLLLVVLVDNDECGGSFCGWNIISLAVYGEVNCGFGLVGRGGIRGGWRLLPPRTAGAGEGFRIPRFCTFQIDGE